MLLGMLLPMPLLPVLLVKLGRLARMLKLVKLGQQKKLLHKLSCWTKITCFIDWIWTNRIPRPRSTESGRTSWDRPTRRWLRFVMDHSIDVKPWTGSSSVADPIVSVLPIPKQFLLELTSFQDPNVIEVTPEPTDKGAKGEGGLYSKPISIRRLIPRNFMNWMCRSTAFHTCWISFVAGAGFEPAVFRSWAWRVDQLLYPAIVRYSPVITRLDYYHDPLIPFRQVRSWSLRRDTWPW